MFSEFNQCNGIYLYTPLELHTGCPNGSSVASPDHSIPRKREHGALSLANTHYKAQESQVWPAISAATDINVPETNNLSGFIDD